MHDIHSKIARLLCERTSGAHFVIASPNWKFQYFEFLAFSSFKTYFIFRDSTFCHKFNCFLKSKIGFHPNSNSCSRGGFFYFRWHDGKKGLFMPFYEVPRVSSFAKLLAIFCSHTRKGNLLAFLTAPPRRPVLTQVLLISQLSNLTIIT